MKKCTISSLLIIAAFAGAAHAAPLDVKPGLWEFTTKMDPNEFKQVQGESMGDMQGQMEKAMADAKAKMTPEQLQQLEKIMAEHPSAKSANHSMPTGMSASEQDSIKQVGSYMQTGQMTLKSCVTQKDIDEAKLTHQEKHENCESKVTQVSSSLFKSVTDCSGAEKMHSEAEVTILNPKAFSSKFVSNMTIHNKPMTLHGEQLGKWLESDCGTYAKNTDDGITVDDSPTKQKH